MAKKRRLKSVLRLLLRTEKDPESMARGLGIGVFVGFLPSIGFQIVLALLLASFFGANRIAAAAGTFVTNPLTAIPVSVFSLWLGDLILPGARLAEITMKNFSLDLLLGSPHELIFSFLIGCFALAVVGGGLAYVGMRVFHSRRRSLETKIQ